MKNITQQTSEQDEVLITSTDLLECLKEHVALFDMSVLCVRPYKRKKLKNKYDTMLYIGYIKGDHYFADWEIKVNTDFISLGLESYNLKNATDYITDLNTKLTHLQG